MASSDPPQGRANLAGATAALTEETRRLMVELNLAALRADTHSWRLAAVESELARCRSQLEIGRLRCEQAEQDVRSLREQLDDALRERDALAARLEAAEAAAEIRVGAVQLRLRAVEDQRDMLVAELEKTDATAGVASLAMPAASDLPGIFRAGRWHSRTGRD
jgi:chromosome segregation ATPase